MKSVVDVEIMRFDNSDKTHNEIKNQVKKLKLPKLEFDTMPTDWGVYWFGGSDWSDSTIDKVIDALEKMHKYKIIKAFKVVETYDTDEGRPKPEVLAKQGTIPRTPLSRYPISTRKRLKFLEK